MSETAVYDPMDSISLRLIGLPSYVHVCDIKYEKFNDTMSAMIDNFFPLKRTSVRKCNKPWMTSSIKSSIAIRQKTLHESGNNSNIYTFCRNKVQSSTKTVRKKYYVSSVEKIST